MIGILDLRWIGYYKIKYGILQKNLSKFYRLESADISYEQFNKFINILKKEKEERKGRMKDKYPGLDQGDKRRNMSDKEMLGKCVDL